VGGGNRTVLLASHALKADTRGFVVKAHRLLKQPSAAPVVDPTSIESPKRSILALEADIEELKAGVRSANQTIASLEAEIAALEDKIEALEADNAALDAVLREHMCLRNYPPHMFQEFMRWESEDLRAVIQQKKESTEKMENRIRKKEGASEKKRSVSLKKKN